MGAGAVPDRVLLGAGQDGDRPDQVGVARQRPVELRVGPEDVRQDDGVLVVGLLAGGGVPVAIAGHRHRVDRVDASAGSAQAGDEQTPGGLDRDRNRFVGSVSVLGEQTQQVLEARRVVTDPELAEQAGIGVDHRHIMMVFGPVDSAGHVHSRLFSILRCPPASSRGRTTRRPNRSARRRTTPSAVRGPSCSQGPRSREELHGSG